MTEKKQVKVYLPDEKADQFRSLADGSFDSNSEAAEQAVDLLMRAHGMEDEDSIEEDIHEIDREMRRVRREANEELASLAEQREELVETLEWRQNQQDLAAMTIGEIVEGLASNPNQNLHAYAEQVEFLVAHSDGPHDRSGVQARVNEYATQNDLHVSPRQLYPDQWDAAGGASASADGSGDSGLDTSRYEFDEDGDSE